MHYESTKLISWNCINSCFPLKYQSFYGNFTLKFLGNEFVVQINHENRQNW